MHDLIVGVGLAMLGAGVWMQFGTAWALITVGTFVVGVGCAALAHKVRGK